MTGLRLETALFDYLTADAGIGALVLDRVYPTRLPEKTTLPAIAWSRVSATRLYTYDSFDDTDAWTTARITFDCWGRTSEEAQSVGEAVLAALSGYGGDMAGVPVGSSFAVDERDGYESATRFYRRGLDFLVSYQDDVANPGS